MTIRGKLPCIYIQVYKTTTCIGVDFLTSIPDAMKMNGKKTRLKFECDANHEAGEIQYDFKTFKILHHFFPGLFFYVYIESPNPKNPEDPTPQAPNPTN